MAFFERVLAQQLTRPLQLSHQGSLRFGNMVKCYEDGNAALQGLKAVQKIETGFHYLNETDTVYNDLKVITVEELEMALKKA